LAGRVIRIVVADDHNLVRQGLMQLVSLMPEVTCVAEAEDGASAIAACLATEHDVLLLDLQMPRGDGLHVLQTLTEKNRLRPTLVLTTFDANNAALKARAAGAMGFLLKDASLATLREAIEALAEGRSYFAANVTERAALVVKASTFDALPSPEKLTPREQQILRLLAGGHSNRELAKALGTAEGTIKNQVSAILSKLGVRDRTRAVLRAIQLGLI
jgi:DNA-binding NarL/FixJ family response regulator